MPEQADAGAGSGGTGDPPGGHGEGDIRIEVVYAEPERAVAKTYRLPRSARLEDALRSAAADPDFFGIPIDGAAAGVYGRLAELAQPLSDGDRVEIYRPLAADPKNARRARARQAARHRRR